MTRTTDTGAARGTMRPASRPFTDSAAASLLVTPRFASGWALLVYVLAAMALAYPALGGAWLVAPQSDQYIAGYAFREFAARSLQSGAGFPQWNPYLFGGMPYIAAMHGDIFYPTFLLRMIMSADKAMTWSFIIHLVLAGFLTYGFLRAWGVGFYGSVIGGLAYMLSGPIAAYASPGHDGKLYVSTLLPLTLWLLVRGIRDGRSWAWGTLAITIALAVLSPHPQLLQYLLLTSGAFAVFLAFGGEGNVKLSREVAFKRLGLALGAVLLGAAIGAVQYLPVREYVDWSPRAGGKGYEHAVSYSLPTEEVLNAVVPEFSGILDNYWGINGIHHHSEYPGIVVLVLAGAGLLAWSAAGRRFRWFWGGTFILSLLWALGGSTPFYRLIYAIVPGTKFFRAPSTMMFVTMFSIAVFAGLGAERIVTGVSSISKRFLWGWAIAIVAIGILFAAGLPTVVAESVANRFVAMGYPPGYSSRTIELVRTNQAAVVLGSLRSIALVLLTLGVIVAVARGKLTRVHAAWALIGLVGIDLWIVEHRYWIFSPPASVVYAPDAAVAAVRNDTAMGRVLTWDPTNARVSRDPAFYDGLMSHGVRLAEGYHGNQLGRADQLIETERARFPFQGLIAAPLSQAFFRHENVHYLYTTLPDSLISQIQKPLQWTAAPVKVAGPIRNTAGSTVYVYRLPGENPPAWVASAIVKGNDEQAMATVLDARFDPERAAIFDTSSQVSAAPLTTAPLPSGVKASVTRRDPRLIDIRLDKPAPAGSALVVSENYFPGWKGIVKATGATLMTARANFDLIGVVLPAGVTEVELRFADPSYATGKVVTLIALLTALVAAAAGVVVERRRPAET